MPEPSHIHVNGQAQRFTPGLTVASLLQQRGLGPQAVATALNGIFVPRDQRALTPLRPGDALSIFEAIVGG